ncbi:MAG: cobalamin/Fe(3+)-siderophore ABC transporter ATP-binding protein [Acidobacteria bacterium]|nr:MAG: cobalamin/Fe(3+)-siderophore ABC transporter ATP-binding protein [Acidobacteriota bacterium]
MAAPAKPVTALLEARGVSAAYGATPALDGVDAVFGRGELVAILGENGSGKSTFLKVIARIVPARAGDVFLEGRPLDGFPRRATALRCLDLVLQGRAPHARGFSADSAEDRDRAVAAMRACDVEALAERDASALSGGETRRVFLARALAQEAEIWLLDEPTSGLDPRHRLEFLELVARVRADRETTVLLVTHEIDLAGEIADRVVLLRGGRALAEGSPDETLTPDRLREAFGVESRIVTDDRGRRRIVPFAPSR